jgi:hypothetical protein
MMVSERRYIKGRVSNEGAIQVSTCELLLDFAEEGMMAEEQVVIIKTKIRKKVNRGLNIKTIQICENLR